MFEAFLGFIAAHSEAVATLVSVMIALLLGVIGYRAQRRRHRREYTLTALAHSLTNPEIMAGKNVIRRLQHQRGCLDPTSITDAELDHVVNALNYYEFISNAFLKGDLDRATVLEQMAGSFLLTYDCAKPYIEQRRNDRGRSKTFRGLERMAGYIRDKGH